MRDDCPPIFLLIPNIALYPIIFVDIWQFIPYISLVTLASINSIPKSFIESAHVNGASSAWIVQNIVLPMIFPLLIAVTMIRFIDAFKVFDTIFVMTQGGPGNSTDMIPYYIYREGVKFSRIGYSSAIATIFILFISLFTTGFLLWRSRQIKRVMR